ncbi:MAG: hypothetical protein KBT34_08030 [Prevotella sp.]|nr:hypothetical protein [Candidatus Prevotella equi]
MKKLLLFLTMALTIVTFVCCTADDEITEEGVPTMARATRSTNNEGSNWSGNLPPDTLTPSMDVFFCDTIIPYTHNDYLSFDIGVSCHKDIFANLNPSVGVSVGSQSFAYVHDVNIIEKECKAHNGFVYWRISFKPIYASGTIGYRIDVQGETPLHREVVPVAIL